MLLVDDDRPSLHLQYACRLHTGSKHVGICWVAMCFARRSEFVLVNLCLCCVWCSAHTMSFDALLHRAGAMRGRANILYGVDGNIQGP